MHKSNQLLIQLASRGRFFYSDILMYLLKNLNSYLVSFLLEFYFQKDDILSVAYIIFFFTFSIFFTIIVFLQRATHLVFLLFSK